MQLTIIAAGLVGLRTAAVVATNAVLYKAVTSIKSAVIIGAVSVYSTIGISHRTGSEPLGGAADSNA